MDSLKELEKFEKELKRLEEEWESYVNWYNAKTRTITKDFDENYKYRDIDNLIKDIEMKYFSSENLNWLEIAKRNMKVKIQNL